MKKWTMLFLTILVLIFLGDIVFAESGEDVLKKMTESQDYKTMKSEAEMIIYNGLKETTSIKMRTYLKKETEEKQLIRFIAPKRLEGTAILMNGENTWYYNRRTNRVRLLSKSAKKGSMMGSSFSYEDMEIDYAKDFTANLLEEKKEYYILKIYPKNEKRYKYLIAKVNKETYVEDYIEYYDENEIFYKKLKIKKVEKIKNIYVPLEIEMDDIANGKRTQIITDKKTLELNIEINDDFFSERKLKN